MSRMAHDLKHFYFLLLIVMNLCNAYPGDTDSTGCPKSFLSRCKCGIMKSSLTFKTRYIVNCTNAGFTNVDMLQDVPEETGELIFSGNTIPELPANVLDNTKIYDDLEVFDMSNNHIRFIQGKSFHKVYAVLTLILNHNDIEITDQNERPRIFSGFEELENLHLTNAFTETINSTYYLLSLENVFYESDLRYLKKLHLEQNEIFSIGTNKSLFCQLPDLEQLYLGDNRLSDLNFRIDCLKQLQYIDVQRNSINRLSDFSTNHLDAGLKFRKDLTVNLENNPFTCDCRSTYFLHWIKTTNVTLRGRDYYTCLDGYPQSNVGKRIYEVEQLECPQASYKEYSASVIGTLSFILAFLSSILLMVAYFHRNKIKGIVVPYWEFVTRKIGYTGIAEEEVPHEVNV